MTGTEWQVPVVAAAQANAVVRVLAFDESGTRVGLDLSDAPFTVEPSPFALTSPNGGETLFSGTTRAITWIPAPRATTYKVQYSLDHGVSWKLIQLTGEAGSIPWRVPGVPASTAGMLRIFAFDGTGVRVGFDAVDAPFAIEPSPFRLLRPNGGETLVSGSTEAITWIAAPFAASYRVQYSSDHGRTWQGIRKVFGGTSTHWIVPQASGGDNLVRVLAFDQSGNLLTKDMSDAAFTIQP